MHGDTDWSLQSVVHTVRIRTSCDAGVMSAARMVGVLEALERERERERERHAEGKVKKLRRIVGVWILFSCYCMYTYEAAPPTCCPRPPAKAPTPIPEFWTPLVEKDHVYKNTRNADAANKPSPAPNARFQVAPNAFDKCWARNRRTGERLQIRVLVVALVLGLPATSYCGRLLARPPGIRTLHASFCHVSVSHAAGRMKCWSYLSQSHPTSSW